MQTEQKNRKRKLLMEAAIYGLLSMIYGSLFFFGALYPRYGFTTACMEEEEERKEAGDEDLEDGDPGEEEAGNEDSENGAPKEQKVVYKSFFWERVREWL